MDSIKLLMKSMKGNRLLYVGAILSVALATAFTLEGLSYSFTIDSVMGDKPMDVPNLVLSIIDSLGGKNT